MSIAAVVAINSSFGLSVYADAASVLTAENNKRYAAIYLRECLAGLGDAKKSILKSEASDPVKIFVTPGKSVPEVKIGQIYKNGDGKLRCDDGNAISAALTTFGAASGEAFLLDIGYTLGSVKSISCTGSGPGGPTGCSNVDVPAYVINGNDSMNSKIPPQSSAARFFGYLGLFNSNCSITESESGAYTQTQIVKDSTGSSYTVKDVKVDFPNSTKSTGTYQGGGSVTTSGATKAIINYDFNAGNTNCRDLLGTLNSLADDVARYNNNNPDNAVTTNTTTGAGSNTQTEDTGTKSCVLEGVGWIVCPVGGAIAGAADALFKSVSHMMALPATVINDPGMYNAWSVFRNIANIAFIIAFLIMVYSQITGVGGNGR